MWSTKIGLSRGHFKDKWNRTQKLIDMWEDLEQKMIGFIERGKGTSLPARCAFGVLLIMETGIRVGNETSAEGYIPVKTEFVKVGDKFTPAKKFNEKKEYVPIPKYVNKPKYIRVDGQFVPSESVKIEPVHTYGLTTLLCQHVTLRYGELRLDFVGKKHVDQELRTKHPALLKWAKVIKQGCQKDERFLGIDHYTLTQFSKTYIGKAFKLKDIRTAKVNLLFVENLYHKDHKKAVAEATKKRDTKRALKDVIVKTAEGIGHTPGVCKSAYISKPLQYLYEQHLEKIRLRNGRHA